MKTSSSFAVEHIGRLYDRQNCLVQSAQVLCAGRFSSGLARSKRNGGLAGVLRSAEAVESGMMVLLEKQVHLQKDVGAERLLVRFVGR